MINNELHEEDFDGSLIDNAVSGGKVAYPHKYGGIETLFWHLDANGAMPASPAFPPMTSDMPWLSVNDGSLRVSATDGFSMYLMYRPAAPAVWVALSKADWTWSETAINSGGTWTGPTSLQPQPTPPSQPSGEAAFPTWKNTAKNFLAVKVENPNRQWKPGL